MLVEKPSLPRVEALSLSCDFLFIRRLNMDLSLVIRRVKLVFLGSLEETTLEREQGGESLQTTAISMT